MVYASPVRHLDLIVPNCARPFRGISGDILWISGGYLRDILAMPGRQVAPNGSRCHNISSSLMVLCWSVKLELVGYQPPSGGVLTRKHIETCWHDQFWNLSSFFLSHKNFGVSGSPSSHIEISFYKYLLTSKEKYLNWINIARGTTDPGYSILNLSYLSRWHHLH